MIYFVYFQVRFHSYDLTFSPTKIAVSLVRDRPGSTDFWQSSTLQDFTKATNIRLSLIKTKTLLGHLMQVQSQDPTVTRRVSVQSSPSLGE